METKYATIECATIECATIECATIECAICWENVEKPKKLDCGHSFHEDCIYDWSIRENNCPMCRKEFKFDGKDYGKWFQNKIKRLSKIRDIKERIRFIVKLVDTVIECSKKYQVLENKSFYKKLIYQVENQKDYLYISFCNWVILKLASEDIPVSYGWYSNTISQLKKLKEC